MASMGKCTACGKTVYQLEGLKVGPYHKEVPYHKACFKCENEGCTWKLTLTSYKYCDGHVYCANHCPMKGFSNKAHQKGTIGMDASAVASATSAPKLDTVNEQVRGGAGAGQKTHVGTDSMSISNATAAPKLSTVNEQVRGGAAGTGVGLDSMSVSNALAAPKAASGVNEQVRAVCPSCNERATGKFCSSCGSRVHTEGAH
eukprot:TRINITY_DN411_c0_g1_i1.p1 TRINITY_DN411_c0_g1~~TRINITY_DN411_c0_g1_i1.p1  ORF type:complete len:220 (+),score=49.82 TRINITY_DN411_c0_g1_i1:59-661(+)